MARQARVQAERGQSARSPRTALLLAGALAVIATAYSSTPSGTFVWDDLTLIRDDPSVHQIGSPATYLGAGFWRASAQGNDFPRYFRPLVVASYAIDWQTWHGQPAGFHLTNVLAHLAVCALVFLLARASGAASGVAAIATAIFGTFPRLTESVAWISGRTDVLAALGGLGALLLYQPGPAGRWRRLGAAVALLLGLLAKETAAAAVLGLMVLAARGRDGRRWRDVAAELAPVVIASAVYVALRAAATYGAAPAWMAYSPGFRLVLPFQALGRYVAMIADPLRPRIGQGLLPIREPAFAILGVAAAIAIGWVAIARARRWPARVAAVAATGLGALTMVLHLVPLRVYAAAWDRFLYLPTACLAITASGLVDSAMTSPLRRRVVAALAGAAVLAFFPATLGRNALWTDEVALWEADSRAADPLDAVVEAELGGALFRVGDAERALGHFRESCRRVDALAARYPSEGLPDRCAARESIASALSELGDYAGARTLLETLVAEEPLVALHRFNLGIVSARQLDFDAAEGDLQEALRLHPSYPEAEAALRLVREVRSEWAQLPPPSSDEAAVVRARRGALDARIGRWREAANTYRAVAAAPDAPTTAIREAAMFLVRHDAPGAEQAIRRLEATNGTGDEALALRRYLSDRRVTPAAH